MPRRFVWFLLTAILFPSCSDDVATGDSENLCPTGERYDPILATCRVVDEVPSSQNNEVDNNQTENSGTENNGTENSGTENNGTENSGTENNQAANSRPGNNQAVCGPGNVIGRACTPTGEVLVGATVTIDGNDCEGQPFTRTTTTG